MVSDKQRHLVVGGHADDPVGDQLGFLRAGTSESAALGLIDRGAVLGQLDAKDFVIARSSLGVNAAVDLHQLGGAAGVLDGKGVGRAKRHAIGGGAVEGASEPSRDIDALRGDRDGAGVHLADLAAGQLQLNCVLELIKVCIMLSSGQR